MCACGNSCVWRTDTGKYEVAVAAPPSVGSAMHAVLIEGCVRWLGLGLGLGSGLGLGLGLGIGLGLGFGFTLAPTLTLTLTLTTLQARGSHGPASQWP